MTVYPALYSAQAYATATSTSTSTGTSTGTGSGTSTSTSTSSATSTCTDNRSTYQGFTDERCYNASQNTRDNNQQNTQDDTKKTNDQGSQQSSMLGMLAIAGGMAMIAAGTAMMASPNPGTKAAGMALIAAGAALLMAGMQAMAAAGEMAQDAGTAGYNTGNMGGISGLGVTSTGTNTSVRVGTATSSTVNNKPNATGVKIDPSLLRTGKSSLILDDFEGKTGIGRDELAQSLMDGKTPAEIMAGNKRFGGQSADAMSSMLSNAAASNGPMSTSDAMDKLGLSAEDLAALGKNTGMSATGEENTYGSGAGGGSGASRKPDSTTPTSFDGMFGGPKADLAGAGVVGGLDGMKLSPEVQAALDRNGITGNTIFHMVRSQYKKKTPMMFGVPQAVKPGAGAGDNPFGNLGNGGKIEF